MSETLQQIWRGCGDLPHVGDHPTAKRENKCDGRLRTPPPHGRSPHEPDSQNLHR